MGQYDDINKAANDLHYRILHEDQKIRESLMKPRLPPEQKKKEEPPPPADEKSKVICTELHRQRLMSRDDYLLGLRYVRDHLTARHQRGYHAWAVPVVCGIRRSKSTTALWATLARARADHIAYLYGDASRRNRFGALLCAVGHPACYFIGGWVEEQDWQALYLDGQVRSQTQA